MIVFLSWSGDVSHEVAKLFNEWLPPVVQLATPWISSQDIESGSIWDNAIQNSLESTNIGIVCLTKENKEKPWILFESGALSKGLSASRVITFLIDLKSDDLLKNPLTKFNHTMNTSESLYKLVKVINDNTSTPMKEVVLKKAFDLNYPEFDSKLKDILKTKTKPESEKPTKEQSMLSEILETVRDIDRKIRNIDAASDFVYQGHNDSNLWHLDVKPNNIYKKKPLSLSLFEYSLNHQIDAFTKKFREVFNRTPTDLEINDYIKKGLEDSEVIDSAIGKATKKKGKSS